MRSNIDEFGETITPYLAITRRVRGQYLRHSNSEWNERILQRIRIETAILRWMRRLMTAIFAILSEVPEV